MSNRGNLCRDGIFGNLQIKGKTVIDKNRDAKLHSLKINQTLDVQGETSLGNVTIAEHLNVSNGSDGLKLTWPEADLSSDVINVGPAREFTTVNEALECLRGKVVAPTIIKVDDGTYADPIVVTGFRGEVGFGLGQGERSTGLHILGDERWHVGKPWVNGAFNSEGANVEDNILGASTSNNFGAMSNGRISLASTPNEGQTSIVVSVVGGDPIFDNGVDSRGTNQSIVAGDILVCYDADPAFDTGFIKFTDPSRFSYLTVVSATANTIVVTGTVDVNSKGSMVMLQSKVIIDPNGSGLCVISTDCTIQGFAFKNTSFSINEGANVFMHENSFDIVSTAFFINIMTVLAGSTVNARRRNRDRTDNSHGHNTFLGNRGTSGGRSFWDLEQGCVVSFSELALVGNSGSFPPGDTFRNDGGAVVDLRFNGGTFVGRQLAVSGCDNGSGRALFAGSNSNFSTRVACFFNVEQECVLLRDNATCRIEALYVNNAGSAMCTEDSATAKIRTAYINEAQVGFLARHGSQINIADDLNKTVTGEENNDYGNIQVALVRAERGACVNFQTAPTSITDFVGGNVYSMDALTKTVIIEEYAEVGNVDGNLVTGILDGAVCSQYPVLISSPP